MVKFNSLIIAHTIMSAISDHKYDALFEQFLNDNQNVNSFDSDYRANCETILSVFIFVQSIETKLEQLVI